MSNSRVGSIVWLSLLLAACGGGETTRVSNDPPEFTGKCVPGLARGFTGGFDDTPVRVINTGEGDGGSGSGSGGVGGDGAGAPGAGVGGALGQFVNVDVSVEFASGERFGPVRVDDAKGMVTVVPCGLAAPALVSFVGAPGSGALYYDEALNRNVSFEGQQLRSIITAFDKNVGVTSFTEAMVRRTERLATEAGVAPAVAWKDIARVEAAHSNVLNSVNDLLPAQLRLADLRRLPVILNQRNFVGGSQALTDSQNGRYGATLAGFAQTGGAHLGTTGSPALEIGRQFSADMADGRIDQVDNGKSVIGNALPAYSFDAFWSNQTLQTTQSARLAGAGSLRESLMQLDGIVVSVKLNGAPAYTYDLRHYSDGTLRYDVTSIDCPGRVLEYSFANIRQRGLLRAISQDGRTYISLQGTLSPCLQTFEIPFDTPGASMVWISERGGVVRATDGRFWFRGRDQWLPLTLGGPRQVQIVMNREFIWGVSVDGELIRTVSSDGQDFVGLEDETGTAAVTTVSPTTVSLPAPVVRISTSDDKREVFALTSTNEVYWIDSRDANGQRSKSIAPRPVKLDVGQACWISSGLVVVACGGGSHRTVKAESDLAVPPIVRSVDPDFGLTVIPAVKGVSVSAPVPAATPIWRSTDATRAADGAITSYDFSSQARLIGIDGSVRYLDGSPVPGSR